VRKNLEEMENGFVANCDGAELCLQREGQKSGH